MPVVAPLADRQERYERMRAMKEAGRTLEQIGTAFGGLSRARVAQILERPPRKPGPPFRAETVGVLRDRLATWEKRRTARIEKGLPTTIADQHIETLIKDIAALRDALGDQ